MPQEFFWRILIPGTEKVIWEGMIDETLAKLILAWIVVGICWIALLSWHRISNYIDADRRKNNDG